MKRSIMTIVGKAVLGLALLTGNGAFAQTTTRWTGNAGTNWFAAGSWDNGVPGDGDNVVIPNTTTKPTMPAGRYPAFGRFGSFEVQIGAVVTCMGDPTIINEESGGTAGSPHGIGVSIFASSASVDGILDANGRGFPPQAGPGGGSGTGGAHGGRSATGQFTYGKIRQPTALGSGGHSAAGGGAIRLSVNGNLSLFGVIRADGDQAGTGPGSGGSIWLEADTFAGTGSVTAIGRQGNASNPRGAGGGRIAIECTTWSFSGTISAAGGWGSTNIYGHGQAGSLWAPALVSQFSGDVTVRSSYQYHFPDDTPRTVGTLIVTDNAWFEPHGGNLTVSNLVVSNGIFRYDRYAYNEFSGGSAMSNFMVMGDIRIESPTGIAGQARGHVWMPAGTQTVQNVTVSPGAILFAMCATNAVNPFSGGTTTNVHGLGLTLRCRNAWIGGTVSAFQYGFRYGPGYSGASGSYGGIGRNGGPVYGRMMAPTALGSGGYNGGSSGSITIHATDTIVLDGLVTANAPQTLNGGGSGGSIWLTADVLAGTGTVTAVGSNANSANDRAAGGGRIALEAGVDNFAGRVVVDGGMRDSYPLLYGQTGTLFRASGVARNLELDGANGLRLVTSLTVSANNRRLDRTVTAWGRNLEWTDRAKEVGGLDSTNTAVYTLIGLVPNQKVTVRVNGTVREELTTADGNGTLVINGVSLSPAATVSVAIAGRGTLLMIR